MPGATDLEHVEEDVELDDGLTAHQMVHHRDVHVVHDEAASDDDCSSQQVTDLSRLQHAPLTRETTAQRRHQSVFQLGNV